MASARGTTRRGEFDPRRGDVLPWLYGIAVNLLRRHRRDEVLAYRAAGGTPANCGVTTYRCAPGGDHLELEDYNRVYRTVGSPENGR